MAEYAKATLQNTQNPRSLAVAQSDVNETQFNPGV